MTIFHLWPSFCPHIAICVNDVNKQYMTRGPGPTPVYLELSNLNIVIKGLTDNLSRIKNHTSNFLRTTVTMVFMQLPKMRYFTLYFSSFHLN